MATALTNGVDNASGLPIDSLVYKPSTAPPAAQNLSQQLGADAFLKLLTTQLQNQDPLNPMDNTQSVAQLAQFSALQASTNLADQFTKFQSNFAVTQAASLIGKAVTVVNTDATTGQSNNFTGTVSGVTITNGTPSFTLKDATGHAVTDNSGKPVSFPTSSIVSIG